MYCISSEYEYEKADDWVKKNVIQPMFEEECKKSESLVLTSDISSFHKIAGIPKSAIKDEIIRFCKPKLYSTPEFWAYFAAYDWIAFAQVFGKMLDLPEGYPMFCLDLKQEMYLKGISKLPEPKGQHNALIDARWNKEMHKVIFGKPNRLRIKLQDED